MATTYVTVTVQDDTKERLKDYKYDSRSDTWDEAVENLLNEATEGSR